jgi:erythromycin esterase-like protein
MWRNVVVRDFVDWLRVYNGSAGHRQAGFYGLDLYSLHRSIQEVIGYLETVDPAAAARARTRYACFDHASADDGQAYGFGAAFGAGPSCEREAISQLVDLQRNVFRYAQQDGLIAADELFDALQNAQTVATKERKAAVDGVAGSARSGSGVVSAP